jgi:hypothetical protein
MVANLKKNPCQDPDPRPENVVLREEKEDIVKLIASLIANLNEQIYFSNKQRKNILC